MINTVKYKTKILAPLLLTLKFPNPLLTKITRTLKSCNSNSTNEKYLKYYDKRNKDFLKTVTLENSMKPIEIAEQKSHHYNKKYHAYL